MNAPLYRPAAPPREPAGPEPPLRERDRVLARAWWIAGAYAGFAGLWIYLSDRSLAALFRDPQLLVRVSVYKGLGFVVITTALLFLLLRRASGATAAALEALGVQEAEVRRLSRLYAALSQINQAIVRTPGRDELFRRLCDALVQTGGFDLAESARAFYSAWPRALRMTSSQAARPRWGWPFLVALAFVLVAWASASAASRFSTPCLASGT